MLPVYIVTILLWIQQSITLLYPHWYNTLLYTRLIDTAIYHVIIHLWIQQSITWQDPDGYSNLISQCIPIDTVIYCVSILITIQHTFMLRYPYWYSNLLRYYTSIDTAIYHVTTLLLIQQSILLASYRYKIYYVTILMLIQQSINWYNNNSWFSPVPRPTPDAAQATADAHGCASSGATGETQCPSSRSRLCYVLLFIVFHVLSFLLSDIPGPRP